MTTNFGRLVTAQQRALDVLRFESEEERERFIKYLADTTETHTRQRLLTWRGNRAERAA